VPGSARPRRIAVIGRAGSGKSTAAVALGRAFDLPVVHLDQLYWTSDWQPVATDRFVAAHRAAVAADSWVIDGGYSTPPEFSRRVRRAELVVITEAPLAVCLYRVIRRTVGHRGRPRADRPHGADEQFSLPFLIWIIRWSRNHPDLRQEVLELAPDATLVTVRGAVDIERLIAG
jgi:adenylate kinase family enzyme